MTVTVDTNVLVRLVVKDDPRQSQLAKETFEKASLVAIGLVTLCEFVWVLRQSYKVPSHRIADFIRTLLRNYKVELNRSAVEAGLALLESGGDFADGVIAFEGSWLGGETFVSFDKTATELLASRGHETRFLR